jgi:hypothetical protein
MPEPRHVDDFIDDCDTDEYAAFVLDWFRRPAIAHARFGKWMAQFRLFCTFEGARYRCTGASRMGDVWLSADFKRENGYEKRVAVDDCKEWSRDP